MGRALFAVGTLLVLCIGGFVLAVYLGREEDGIAVDNLLAEDVTRAIALSEIEGNGRVDLRSLARGPWTEVLVVARDAPDSAIPEALGAEWRGELRFRTGELLIFVRDGRVVRFADYRGEGTFEGFDEPVARLPRSDAVLEVGDLVVSPA